MQPYNISCEVIYLMLRYIHIEYRPLRDDEVLPVRTHRIVDDAPPAINEDGENTDKQRKRHKRDKDKSRDKKKEKKEKKVTIEYKRNET